MRKYKRNKLRRIIFITFVLMIIIIAIMLKNKNGDKLPEETIETFSSSDISMQTTDDIIVVTETKEIDSKVTDWNLILVNKENKISDDYKFELTTIEYGHRVDTRISESLIQMLNDARKEGLMPLICSSYRTSSVQKTLFNKKVNQYKKYGYSSQEAEEKASYWVTFPRTSEHEIGMAVDIVSKNFQILDERQENTSVQKWLVEHCNNYGFILRYPTDKKDITKINYEPWHYRYVGVENAKFMQEKNYCLEEYIEYLKH